MVGMPHVCGESIESDMLTALFTSLTAAFGPWLPLLGPLLGLLLGVGGPLCIYLQGRAATQVAEITAGAQVTVAEITAAAQVEVARVAAARAAQMPEVPRTAVEAASSRGKGGEKAGAAPPRVNSGYSHFIE